MGHARDPRQTAGDGDPDADRRGHRHLPAHARLARRSGDLFRRPRGDAAIDRRRAQATWPRQAADRTVRPLRQRPRARQFRQFAVHRPAGGEGDQRAGCRPRPSSPVLGLILSIVIAVPLGILAAVKQGSWIDHTCRIVATAGVSLPVFFTGLLLVYVFYYQLGWSPAPIGRLDAFATAPPRSPAST